jgi:cytochrome c-type biogenesis protein
MPLTGWLDIPFLGSEIRQPIEFDSRRGNISFLLMGVLFAIGWTPGVGPTLGIVLTLAGIGASMTNGILLLALYSWGLGLPIIITVLVMDREGQRIRSMAKLTQYVMPAAGIFLAGAGKLMILG